MKQHERLWTRLVTDTDLEGGALPGIPVIEIVGKERVLVENHCGICAYGSCEICINVKYGKIRVMGDRLELMKMAKHQLIICGRIDSIQLLGGDADG